jgi:hypothetical protein
MQNICIESLRKKSVFLTELPATVRVPGHGGNPTIDGLQVGDASVDDLAFAIQGLESELSPISGQLHALRKLYDLARHRGAIGTDKVGEIFGGED